MPKPNKRAPKDQPRRGTPVEEPQPYDDVDAQKNTEELVDEFARMMGERQVDDSGE